ncbi:Dual specificity phosphatase ibp1 [Wallemia ichthyophaga EXF-994]|uniref:Dual specificity phosphatase ibp1 n=1 Tax=Wallemia ichthyophaga (strain EXF-994 / CBS 113033) TaxID=1299270 RepID=R9AEY4_WALI9|nr:Dual specificity phosphatase ibp1 [Wallemia ichthyophaga EXF-994]EOQ98645.1 Dual specificity phosphatase ibp1 [Wallemia ichthyophaga EXF-994]
MQAEDHPINFSSWWHVYGEPKATFNIITVDQLSKLYYSEEIGRDFVVIDVRRSDLTEMIPGAINLPAQSLPQALPSLIYSLGNIDKFIFHCNSSKGRGPRAAGWFADALNNHVKSVDPSLGTQGRVFVLEGGINSWKEKFGAQSIEDRGKPWDHKTMSSVQL